MKWFEYCLVGLSIVLSVIAIYCSCISRTVVANKEPKKKKILSVIKRLLNRLRKKTNKKMTENNKEEKKKNYTYLIILGITVGAAILFWALAIIAYRCFDIYYIDKNNVILTFVGILATFVVVSNYAQISEIKNDIEYIKSKKDITKEYNTILEEYAKEEAINMLLQVPEIIEDMSKYKITVIDDQIFLSFENDKSDDCRKIKAIFKKCHFVPKPSIDGAVEAVLEIQETKTINNYEIDITKRTIKDINSNKIYSLPPNSEINITRMIPFNGK